MKRIITFVLAVAVVFSLIAIPASAKTQTSAKAENVFVYVTDTNGRSVLIDVLPLSELKALAHGRADGGNYCVSSTDNYPTTQYCEGRGFTVGELLDYVKNSSSVSGAKKLSLSGGDTLRFMATDSYGSYTRSITYEKLYGIKRYYFEGMYSKWNSGWEVSDGKSEITSEEYEKTYRARDAYYDDKRAVFSGGVVTEPVLMTDSYSGRTTADTLTSSTEPGIAGYVSANGGKVTGCLKNALTDECALRLALPMTEADLMTGHRTAFDGFKWIYNIQLDCKSAAVKSAATIEAPVPTFRLDGDKLTVTFKCPAGASVYYGFDGAPQTLCTGAVSIDVSGRDLQSNPVTVYAAAVKEGCDDAGVQIFRYPGTAPGFQTLYSGKTGSDLTFTAAQGVSDTDWSAWTKAISFISLKAPSGSGYIKADSSKYTFNTSAKSITFDKSLFAESGSYSFRFHAAKYADKSVSVTLKAAAPAIKSSISAVSGSAVVITFADESYKDGLSVYITPENGSRTMISGSYIDKSKAGEITLKSEYFTAASSAAGKPGRYTLELANNNYYPADQTLTLTLMQNAGFSDVPADAWYYVYVTELADAGIINGVGNGLFSPAGTLTYAQAMKLLLTACGYGEQSPTGAHWGSGYMDKAENEGFIPAKSESDAPISRLNFCRAAAKALRLDLTAAQSRFTDTDDASVLALCERGIINGIGDGRFEPDATLNRAQISKIIWCIRNQEESK